MTEEDKQWIEERLEAHAESMSKEPDWRVDAILDRLIILQDKTLPTQLKILKGELSAQVALMILLVIVVIWELRK